MIYISLCTVCFLLIMVVAGDYYVLLGWFGLPALPTQLVCLNQIWPHNKKAFFCNVDRRGMIPLLASKMQKRLLPLKAVTKIIIIPFTSSSRQQPATYGIYYCTKNHKRELPILAPSSLHHSVYWSSGMLIGNKYENVMIYSRRKLF